jgi:hypothetical protein
MFAWILNDEAGEGGVEVPRLALLVGHGRGRGRQVDHGVEEEADAEVGERRADEDGGRDAAEEGLDVEVVAGGGQQRQLLLGRLPRPALLLRGLCRVDHLLGGLAGPPGRLREAHEAAVAPVDHATEVAGDPDGPGDGRGDQPQLVADLVEQLERLPPRPVELVEEREQRDAPVPADLEQLARLRLDALGDVETMTAASTAARTR